MNYSPIDYTSMYDNLNQVQNHTNDLTSLKYHTEVEDAQTDIYEIEKNVEKISSHIQDFSNEAMNNLFDIIYNAYIDKLEQYKILVNAGYEEETFPYYDWYSCIKDNSWLFSNRYAFVKPLLEIESDKSIEITMLLMQNIIELSQTTQKCNVEEKIIIFNNCMDICDNLPNEYRESFIEHFVFSKDIYKTYINKIEFIPKLSEPEYLIDNRASYYLNYLFSKNPQDLEINKTLQAINKYKNEEISSKIISNFIHYSIDSNFIKSNRGMFQKIIVENFEKLFELDLENNSKLTPFIVTQLRNIQSSLMKTNKQVEVLENTINYLEKGYQVHYLNSIIPNKPLEKKLLKI